MSSFQRREWLQGYLFAAPFLIGFFAVRRISDAVLDLADVPEVGLALAAGVRRAAEHHSGRSPTSWRCKSLVNSAIYTLFAVPFQLVISFTLALALTQPIKFRSLYRAGFYLPIIIPIVATAVVWQRVLHPDFGILNTRARAGSASRRSRGCSSPSWPSPPSSSCRSG